MKVFWIGLFLVCAASASAIADEEALPRDYVKITSNKEYVFVMLAPQDHAVWFSKEAKIRKTYSSSGLYRNDGSSQPLWTVKWYSFEVYLTSDGKYVAAFGPWSRLWAQKDMDTGGKALKQQALAFFKEGVLLKSYTIANLIKEPNKLQRSVSHFQWQKYPAALDESNSALTVETYDGQKLVFDIQTGNIKGGAKKATVTNRGDSYEKSF